MNSHNVSIEYEQSLNELFKALQWDFSVMQSLFLKQINSIYTKGLEKNLFEKINQKHLVIYAQEEWIFVALSGNKDLIEYYASQYEFVSKSHSVNNITYNPVYYAALSGNLEAVKYCIENLKIKIASNDGMFSALWRNTNTEIREYLQPTHPMAKKFQNSKAEAQKLLKEIGNNNKSIAHRIAKVFNDYAHPGLFSLNWRHGANQKLAANIAKHLTTHDLSASGCKQFIDISLQLLKNKPLPWGTLQAVLIALEESKIYEENNDALQVKKHG